jgi:hypothetical protein
MFGSINLTTEQILFPVPSQCLVTSSSSSSSVSMGVVEISNVEVSERYLIRQRF